MQYVGEQQQNLLELHIYYAEEMVSSMLYENAGVGDEYLEDKANKVSFLTEGNTKEVTIRQKHEGSYKPEYPRVNMIFYGLPFTSPELVADEQEFACIQEAENNFSYKIPYDFSELSLRDTKENVKQENE